MGAIRAIRGSFGRLLSSFGRPLKAPEYLLMPASDFAWLVKFQYLFFWPLSCTGWVSQGSLIRPLKSLSWWTHHCLDPGPKTKEKLAHDLKGNPIKKMIKAMWTGCKIRKILHNCLCCGLHYARFPYRFPSGFPSDFLNVCSWFLDWIRGNCSRDFARNSKENS